MAPVRVGQYTCAHGNGSFVVDGDQKWQEQLSPALDSSGAERRSSWGSHPFRSGESSAGGGITLIFGSPIGAPWSWPLPTAAGMTFKEHRRMRRGALRSDRPSDRAQRPGERAAVGGRQRGNRANQVFLHGDRGSTKQTPSLRRHGEPLTTAVLARREFRDEPLPDKPLNHDRDGALVRACERRDVIDRRIGMLGDLLKREKLCAAEPRVALACAADPQRLNDVAERVERHRHVGRMGRMRAVRDLPQASTQADGRRGARIPRRSSTAGSCPAGGSRWYRGSHVDIIDYMGFNIS
jgi:hypothetical protein